METSEFTVEKHRVDFYYWKVLPNFGDYLSYVIVSKILEDVFCRPINDCVSKRSQLLAVGSVVHFSKEGSVLWGSGTLHEASVVLLVACTHFLQLRKN
jgi:hypothetical protein